MSGLDNLERQHRDIRGIIKNLTNILEKKDLTIKDNAKLIRKELSMLAGKLRIHMQREDEFLYPNLLKSDDNNLKNTAEMYVAEMGNLADKFQKFNSRYLRFTLITEDAEEFKRELKGMLTAIKERIEREDRDLYPLLDK